MFSTKTAVLLGELSSDIPTTEKLALMANNFEINVTQMSSFIQADSEANGLMALCKLKLEEKFLMTVAEIMELGPDFKTMTYIVNEESRNADTLMSASLQLWALWQKHKVEMSMRETTQNIETVAGLYDQIHQAYMALYFP